MTSTIPTGPVGPGRPVITVMIVDDQRAARMGLALMVNRADDLDVIAQAANGQDALDQLAALTANGRPLPDVVLMDVRMPGMNGIEATRRIVESGTDGPKVIVLTTFDLDEYAYEAIRAGAGGFLLKDASLDELMAAIRHVHAGDAVMAPSTTRRLMERFMVPPPAFDGGAHGARTLENLTAREREVLALLARGLSNEGIGRDLSVAEGTVRVHVSRILGKLGLRDRAQAVVLAYESGLVLPGGRQGRF